MIEFLPVIAPGKPPREFFKELQNAIEQASDRLIEEALIKDPSLKKLSRTTDLKKSMRERPLMREVDFAVEVQPFERAGIPPQ